MQAFVTALVVGAAALGIAGCGDDSVNSSGSGAKSAGGSGDHLAHLTVGLMALWAWRGRSRDLRAAHARIT